MGCGIRTRRHAVTPPFNQVPDSARYSENAENRNGVLSAWPHVVEFQGPDPHPETNGRQSESGFFP